MVLWVITVLRVLIVLWVLTVLRVLMVLRALIVLRYMVLWVIVILRVIIVLRVFMVLQVLGDQALMVLQVMMVFQRLMVVLTHLVFVALQDNTLGHLVFLWEALYSESCKVQTSDPQTSDVTMVGQYKRQAYKRRTGTTSDGDKRRTSTFIRKNVRLWLS